MTSIDEILNEIDKSFSTTKDTIKEGIKKMYDYTIDVEKGMREDPVFKDFINKSDNAALEAKKDEMLKNVDKYQDEIVSHPDPKEIDKATFYFILSSVTLKLVQEELDRRNANKESK